MSAEQNFRRALSALDSAKRRVKQLKSSEDEDVAYNARRALRELEQAESEIRRALRDLD